MNWLVMCIIFRCHSRVTPGYEVGTYTQHDTTSQYLDRYAGSVTCHEPTPPQAATGHENECMNRANGREQGCVAEKKQKKKK
ncbi:hypothetical protein F5Y09DRAFT_322014 [Xylaria sp. FL1042]|nr:hypothetical protein F5Y09DRAFT_322014 [Xylaria sp. FL1042]